MRYLTLVAIAFVMQLPTASSVNTESSMNPVLSSEVVATNQFQLPEKSVLKAQLGRRLTLKEAVAYHALKHQLKKEQRSRKAPTGQSNGMAVAGFVCGIVSLFFAGFILGILGIIFSAIALSRIKKEPGVWSGKGLATAGLILGIVGFIGSIIVIGLFIA